MTTTRRTDPVMADDIRLAPMFDVVSTRIYRYQRSPLHATLASAQADERIPKGLVERQRPVWEAGMAFARHRG